jgi:hypothetical protein
MTIASGVCLGVYEVLGLIGTGGMLKGLEARGGPVPIVEGVRRSTADVTGIAHFSVSDTGSLIYIPGPTRTRTIERAVALADRAGVLTRLPVPAGPYVHLCVSRDGARLAVGSDDDKETIVWIYRLDGTSAMQRLTLEGRNRFPIWSRGHDDGRSRRRAEAASRRGIRS